MGPLSLCSQVLLLPLGGPPTPGARNAPHKAFPKASGVRRALPTTSDVENVTQGPGPFSGAF